MKTKLAVAGWVCWSLCACAGPHPQTDRDQLFREVVSSMPAYQDFLTVDELHGALESLQEILDESLALFEEKAAEVEADLDYTVVPITKLASVQLVTALHAMDHIQNSPEFAAR